jgi:hypothetical protein
LLKETIRYVSLSVQKQKYKYSPENWGARSLGKEAVMQQNIIS